MKTNTRDNNYTLLKIYFK